MKICVIGLGYVGLPLAIAFAKKGHNVIGADISEKLMDLVTNHMLKLQGIAETETLFAFRVYSRKDMECMFSIGMGI